MFLFFGFFSPFLFSYFLEFLQASNQNKYPSEAEEIIINKTALFSEEELADINCLLTRTRSMSIHKIRKKAFRARKHSSQHHANPLPNDTQIKAKGLSSNRFRFQEAGAFPFSPADSSRLTPRRRSEAW